MPHAPMCHAHRYWRAQVAAFKAGRTRTPPSLARACWAVGGGTFLAAIPWKLINDASQFVGPLALNALLAVIEVRCYSRAAF